MPRRSRCGVTGPELRKLRRDQNWNQERLATLLDISKGYLQSIESSPDLAKDQIADRFATLQRALRDGVVKSDADKPHLRFQDFRSSVNFTERPPFVALPTCPCENSRCRLSAIKDGDWQSQHLWKFQGKRCLKIRYVDSNGKIVPTPRKLKRDPLLQTSCSRCGRLRQIDRRYRARLGGYALTLRCVPQAGDVPDQRHDPPERFVERDGKVRLLTAAETDELRNRSTVEFQVPSCELVGCPKFGKRMEHSTDLSKTVTSGEVRRIAMYACRPCGPAKSHYAYRALPHGEVVEQIAEGRYRWNEAQTGEQHETIRKKRSIRASRAMPEVRCKLHDCLLQKKKGPWGRGRKRRWSATCPVDGKAYQVRPDGSVLAPSTGSRRQKRGRRPGKLKTTEARIIVAADLLISGVSQYAMRRRVYPEQNIDERAYANVKVFFGRYRDQINEEGALLKSLSKSDREQRVGEAQKLLPS